MANEEQTDALLRILVVDDDDEEVTALETLLRDDFEVVTARNGLDALEKLERVEPDLAIMDVGMPCLNGFDTVVSIRKNAQFRNLPIVFLTASGDRESLETGRRLDAALYETKPYDPRKLVWRIDQLVLRQNIEPRDKTFDYQELLLSERTGMPLEFPSDGAAAAGRDPNRTAEAPGLRPARARLLVVDDEPDVAEFIRATLADEYETLATTRSTEAIETIIRAEPDILLLDIEMPDLNGYQLSQLLKLNNRLRQIKIIFVTSRTEPKQVEYGYRLGAAGYVTKPFEVEDLKGEIQSVVSQSGFAPRPKKRSMEELREEG